MGRNSRYLAIAVAILFISCNGNVIFEKNVKIPDYKWDMNNAVKLDVEIKDTTSSNDIYINVRNGSGYEFSNLFLFLTTKTPKGETARDTLELTLADASGKWLGQGMGDTRDCRILFKKNFRFTQSGNWHFELEQAMRMDPLPQIMDVGLRIEKAK